MIENKIKDDFPSYSTSNRSDDIIKEINNYEQNNLSIITNSIERIVPNIVSFLINNENSVNNKIKIVRFLQNLFIKNEMNSEIFSRICQFNNIKLNPFQIIVHEYLIYKENSKQSEDEIAYRRELLVLFDILLTQITFDRESYHYILSFIINILNQKNNNLASNQNFSFNSEFLNRILLLLNKFYHPFDTSKFYGNYFFFTGGSSSSIIIQNKTNNKDNKKILILEDKIYILLFFKIFPAEYIQSSSNEVNFNLIKIKLNEKNKESEISIGTDINNNISINLTNSSPAKLSEKETNCLLLKLKKKKKFEVKLYLNEKKIFENKNVEREKPEIKEILLFENFIGICFSFMIFKNNIPKFLKNEIKPKDKENFNNKNKKSIYSKGLNSEELIIPILKMELKEENEQNNNENLINNSDKNTAINNTDYKDFIEKIISIYIPSRVSIPTSNEKNSLLNTPKLIIEDSINDLNGEFNTKYPTLNGVHIYKKIKNDFNEIGGLNNLLPIMELMINDNELLTKENIENFFDIIISIFSPYYKNALINEAENNFFLYLSYFMEKIPATFYDNYITNIFKKISSFFTENLCEENYNLNYQYQNYILMNERILFKFHYKEQNEIIESMSHFIQNIKQERKKALSLDIFKIIKIILHLDEKKNKLFCCKKHEDFFIKKNGIMEPELYLRLCPIKELLKHLFKEYKRYVIEKKSDAIEEGKSLFKIVTMLASDISPCLQKMIIQLISECLEEDFELYMNGLDQENEMLNIILFVFKNSILDIKGDALNLIFLIIKNNKFDISKIPEDPFQFITNNILPYFLLQDEEIIKNTISTKSENKDIKNTTNINDYIIVENEEKEIKEIENIKLDTEKGEEIDLNTQKGETPLFDEIYGDNKINNPNNDSNHIQVQGIINDIKYSLPLFNENLKLIYEFYNKKKLKFLVYNLYKIVIKNFNDGNLIQLCINLLIKLVSKGDLIMIYSFVEKLYNESFNNSNNINKVLDDELKNNQHLLQWLIETCFHAKLLIGNNFDVKIFVPGFEINNYINEEGNIIELSHDEKIEKINKIVIMSQKLISKILVQNIYKLDYIFSWGKYYYELRNKINNFRNIRELILSFMPEIAVEYIKDMAKLEKSNFQMSVYFFNLLFEFVTFYKFKQEDLEQYEDESSIYKELSQNLKYILISKMDDTRGTLKPIDVQEQIVSKFEEYPLFKSVYANWTPIWCDENKICRQKNDIYSLYIKNKKNVDIKELEYLFYNFIDLEEFKYDKNKYLYVNKGIPLIFILYHFFTLIFSIGGTEGELGELLFDFRLFFILLIISSSTLSSQGGGKKKRWPSEEEYKDVQIKTESIFFNLIYFFINRIKNIDEKIKLSSDIGNDSKSNEDKYLLYIKNINALFKINLGYILKILNNLYKEKKREEEKNKGITYFIKGIKSMFTDTDEIKKSGGYKLMDKIYSECPNLSSGENNYLDKITELKFDKFFPQTKISERKKVDDDKIFKKLEENISTLIDDTELYFFFEKHSEENKKILFPFISYISARRDAVKNIIPIYDIRPNILSYPKDYYLVPDYIPENPFDTFLLTSINPVYTQLTKSIKLDIKSCQLEQQYKSHNYKKEKERLFSFKGIWSNNEIFYDKNKFRLKYRLLNHLTEDYIRVFLTPIIDMDYYLPQFSKFDEKDLFRKISSYKQINKVTDLSFEIKKSPPEIVSSKKETKITPSQNDKELNNSSKLIEKEDKQENNFPQEINEKKEEEKNALYYIEQEIFNNMKEEKKNDLYNYLFIEYIHKKHTIIDSDCFVAKACYIRIGFHILGYIFNNSKGIGFYSFESNKEENDEDYDEDRKVCFGSVFRTQNYKYNNFYIWIPYNKIQMAFKRRYFFKRQAIEIFTYDRKSYLFKLKEDKIPYFIEHIKYYMEKDIEDIYITYNKFDEKIGFFNKNNVLLNFNMNFISNEKKSLNIKNIYEKWYKWEISTLKLLMILNIYGNRSYNDINQYPVFPWIITDYISETLPNYDKLNFIRPLNKPMGMLDFTEESKERKENYEMHWIENENDPDKDEDYDRYGSHYSTSLYLTYYLVRVFPFSYIRIELQGKKFDDPNRLFNILSNSFENAISQKADLRELIPELFCFPEMFLNINDLNLGQISDSKGNMKNVEGVEMPLWANKNPYIFIEKHREILESAEISEKINEWFNIIFGSKQKGKEAKKIKNLFVKQTYEDYEEDYIKLKKADKIYKCRMVEFGVTPNQIFKNDTYKRQNVNDNHKIKRSLLFNVMEKLKKNQKLYENELDFDENKINSKENIQTFFVFIVNEKEIKKERIFLLKKNKIEIYTKNRPTIIKSNQNKNLNNKIDDKEKEDNNDDINDEDNTENVLNNDNNKEKSIEESNDSENVIQEKNSENNKLNKKKGNTKFLRFKNDKKFEIPKYRMNSNQPPTIFYQGGNIIVLGGFWNGDILLKLLNDSQKTSNKKMNIIKTRELYPVTKIIIDKTETFVICANLDGTVFIYIIDVKEKMIWNFHKKINEGQGEIMSMEINENLGIFIVCFKNGYCMVYTLPKCKLINSFLIEEHDLNNNNKNKDNNLDVKNESSLNISNNIYSPNIVFISNSSLPCFIFYIKERKSICIYSINAQFLKECKLGYELVNNGIIKYTDYSYRDFLFIYNPINYTIDIYKITDLNLIFSSPIFKYQFINFHFSMDLDSLYVLTKDKNTDYKMLILKQAKILGS